MPEIDKTTAYYKPAATHNARLTEVMRGTPMGELMRRYWHAIGLASYATQLPRPVRVLGEDLILFRDGTGRAGLLHQRCCHRGSSLFYGKVEDQGLRCCYHGWLFDVTGRCLERPAEPSSGPTGSVRQPWYPVEERYGLIWAYLGPMEKKPLLPRYDVFDELGAGEQLWTDDQNIGADCWTAEVPFNWLQHYENIHDVAHFYWLHYLHSGPQFGDRFGELDLADIRKHLYRYTQAPKLHVNERGLTATLSSRLADGGELVEVVETVLPTLRVVANPWGKAGRVDSIGFVLPVDNTHFKIFTVLRAADRSFFDMFVSLRHEDEARSIENRQRQPSDFEAQASQGPITLHGEEHLGTSDRAIVALRRLYEKQIAIVESGGDPIGVHFKPGTECVKIEGGLFLKDSTAETAGLPTG